MKRLTVSRGASLVIAALVPDTPALPAFLSSTRRSVPLSTACDPVAVALSWAKTPKPVAIRTAPPMPAAASGFQAERPVRVPFAAC